MPDSPTPNIIFSYTRADALADGVLIDITPLARNYGFKLPFAISDALYHGYVEPPEDLEALGQSLEGRLHDLLTLANVSARRSMGEDRVYFKVAFQMRPEKPIRFLDVYLEVRDIVDAMVEERAGQG